MTRGLSIGLFTLSLISLLGCKARTDDTQGIRDGVVKHIASLQGLDINRMQIDVVKATVDGNQAQAQVEIRPKSEQSGTASMQLNYSLEKRGDEWVVVKSQAAGGTLDHPVGGAMPSGTTPGGALPPGHPAVGASGNGAATHSNFSDIMRSAQPPAQQPQVDPAPSSSQHP
jgi:hypothetical protein